MLDREKLVLTLKGSEVYVLTGESWMGAARSTYIFLLARYLWKGKSVPAVGKMRVAQTPDCPRSFEHE